MIRRLLDRHGLDSVKLVSGGSTRARSVGKALAEVSGGCDWILVHDAARPFVSRGLVGRLLKTAARHGAAVCAIPLTSTVKKTSPRRDTILKTVDREGLFLAQTPQVFRKNWFEERYRSLGKKAARLTDEASFFEGTSVRVKIVEGDPRNIKVTTPEDLELCKWYLGGYDARRHRL
jgi:2-C-methyl-D-erythritol 4-phosphate cytidylyltransferase